MVSEETWILKKAGIRHSLCEEQGGDGKERKRVWQEDDWEFNKE